MLKIIRLFAAIVGGAIVLLASLQALPAAIAAQKSASPATPIPPTTEPVSIADLPNINDLPLQDNPNVYQYDDPGSVVTMYITVRRGNVADNSDYSWADVNSFTKWIVAHNNQIVTVGKADVILQVGDENGPLPGELGYDAVVPNATIQIRGASTSQEPQKSFKIEIKKGEGAWRGQRTIALNKHIFDPSRVRNKLNFDLLKQIPDLVSLRTQFVHLYVKDETTNPWKTNFEDYGLFTQVELPNKTYLKVHKLDPDGQLYKPTFFEFNRYPDQLRLVDDPQYDEDAFSTILENKGNRDNSKLLQMLDDVNNYDIPISTTFEKYFNADNYFTWTAYNILVGSVDTQTQNFYLYSPHNSTKFYFIPWDYDDALFRSDRETCCRYAPYVAYDYGIANYWGVRLTNRLLRIPEYRSLLDEKVEQLRSFLTPERIQGMLAVYKPIAEKYALRTPDSILFPTTKEGMERDFEVMPTEVEKNYQLYLESLKSPMPFFLNTPLLENNMLHFSWGESYDFNGEDIVYKFLLATDPSFEKPTLLIRESLVNGTEIDFAPLKPGKYFWQVIATNKSGLSQLAFDTVPDANGALISGVKEFEITDDGKVVEK